MIILFIIIAILALFSIRPLPKGCKWNDDYISRNTTNIIKGICIWLVFISHIGSYMWDIPQLTMADHLMFYANSFVRQLLVVPFLFFSGYGVTLALKKKGEGYANGIPRKRIMPTLINFDIAVFIFLLMNIAIGREIGVRQTLLSFTGWDSIGNSNWYIFCILICYSISWFSYKVFGNSKLMIPSLVMGLLAYWGILYFFKGHWWYDTILAYGAGCCFAWWKDAILKQIKRNYWSLLSISLACFLISYNAPNQFSFAANITAVFLCALIVLTTCKIKLKSKILSWSGQQLFPLYIYQRLPMVVLSDIGGGAFMNEHRYLYIICCIILR